MLTWRIHRTLDDPLKREPISWRGYETRLRSYVTYAEPRLNRFKPVYSMGLLVLFSPFVGLGVIAYFFPSPILALLISLIFGLQTVERLSGYIAGEHRRHTYELLSALPYGKLGVHWLYAVQWFQSTRLSRMMLRTALAISIAATPFLFGGLAYQITGRRAVEFWFADSLAFWVFLLYEYFNTRVIAILIAMLTPAVTHKPRTIYALSVGLYLLVQVGTYLLGALLALNLLPELLGWLNAPPLVSLVISPITVAVVIYIREWITRRLWRWLAEALHTTSLELDLLLR